MFSIINKCFIDYRSFIFLGLFTMQMSVLTQAVFGDQGKVVFLAFGFIEVIVGSLLIMLSVAKIRVNIGNLKLLLFLFLLFELIIWLRQPELTKIGPTSLRIICYFLIVVGYLSSKLNYYQSKLTKTIYDFIIPFLILCTAILYNNSLKSLALYAKGRVTVGEDISSVGLAFSLCLMASFCLSQVFSSTKVRTKFIYLTATLSLIPPVIASASRGALLSLSIVLVIYLVVSIYVNRRSFKYVFLVLISFVLFLLVAYSYISSNDFLNDQLFRLIERFSRVFDVSQDDQSSVARSVIVSLYLDDLEEFIYFGYPGYAGPYPHNLFLDLFIRFGILGFIVAVVVYYKMLIIGLNIEKLVNDRVLNGVLGVVLFSFINAQMSMTSEFLRFFWFGLVYLSIDIKQKNIVIKGN